MDVVVFEDGQDCLPSILFAAAPAAALSPCRMRHVVRRINGALPFRVTRS
jgi:hypothetical protein